jgi:hypothetical protein
MAQAQKLATSGLAAVAVAAITGDSITGVTAAGSTQATATAVNASVVQVATAAASTGIILPTGQSGDTITVYNAGANSLSVYPPIGAAINSGAANAAFAVATTKSATFTYASATLILANLSA